MATQNNNAAAKKRRKRSYGVKKLLINEKVEVSSVEDGFLGSWRVGTVVGCGEQSRQVKYDEILNDDDSKCLVEWVKVNPVLDGLVPRNQGTSSTYRGNIRPIPPSIDFQEGSLHYGQCVDTFYQDAWWEGVIFDHDDGSNERKVFFPDMGDEVKAQIETLRITQEWDEVTEEWRPRGNWLLLKLIEEVEPECPLLVSVRQLWYEIQVQMEFDKLMDWTASSRDVWKQLLLQVLSTCYKLTVKQIFNELKSSDLPTDLNNMNLCASEEHTAFAQMDTMVEPNDSTHSMKRPNETSCVQTPALSILPPNQNHTPEVGSGMKSRNKLIEKLKASADRTRLHWLSAGTSMVPEAACCPDSVADYIEMRKSNRRTQSASKILEVRKHISYLGWKIEFARDKSMTRMRYISPTGEIYLSLYQVCLLLHRRPGILSPISQHNKRNHDGPTESLISSPFTGKAQACTKRNHDGPTESLISSPFIGKAQARTGKVLPYREVVYIEPDHCPEAVMDYSESRMEIHHVKNGVKTDSVALKAKKHLSSMRWNFYREKKGDKMEMRYESPCGKRFYSLRTACKWYVAEGKISTHNNAYASKEMQKPFTCRGDMAQLDFTDPSPPLVNVESEGHMNNDLSKRLLIESSSNTSQLKQLVQQDEVKSIRELERKRKHGLLQHSLSLLQTGPQNDGSHLIEEIKQSEASIEKKNCVNAELSASMLQPSKGARQSVVSSSTQKNHRTTLSWLIDNNVVFPSAKVHYRGKKDGLPMKEGNITREGIICTCCKKVFNLSKFEAHAGSNYHRPSANTFLEDGRSISQCLLQLKHDTNGGKTKSEPQKMKGHRRCNDSICSVCHDGGELVLCDRCPSAFHMNCLGLKEVPHGDWFCPSCCCGICGISRLNENTEQPIDDRFINCGQCEHQYHIECLRNKGLVTLDYYPEGNWFCNKRCEQIHLGLHHILGKPIPVGHDNLTWTLLKSKNVEESAKDGLDNKHLMESYDKLNVALHVMHECFEPVKVSRTRDLVEDVIFSRWSELNRLNFQGFYTILLERNDNSIAVAAVRVYGERVAEIPLVATRSQYRRLGMCRILMNELEKILMKLGVERLVLPAVPNVLNTWETSFGFSRMTESERLNFLDCTFLYFRGTVMCQKLLKNIPCTELSQSTEVQQKLCDHICKHDVDLEGNDAVSEVFQADPIEESGTADQGAADFLREIGSNSNSVSTPINMVNQPPETVNQLSPVNFLSSCQNEFTLGGYSVNITARKEPERDNAFKRYKRRRLATCGS